MSLNKDFWKRVALVQLLVFTLTFGMVSSARAQGIVYGSTLPAGQVIDNDAILVGDVVTIDGTVTGDVLAVGRDVQINGTIEGSLIVAGETVTIGGEVGGTTYAAAVELELTETASTQRNLYYAGLSLVSQPGAQVGRDLVAYSLLGAQLAGSTGRNVKAIIGPSELIKLIMEFAGNQGWLPQGSAAPADVVSAVGFSASGIDGAVGSLSINTLQAVTGAFLAEKEWSETELVATKQDGAQIDSERLGEWALESLREFVTLLVYGFLGLWLFSSFLNRSADALSDKPLPSLGYGLLALVIAVNIFGVAILIAVLLLIVGLWLGFVTLWELSFAFWAVGYLSLGLATVLFALFVIYGTTIIVSYLIGKLLLKLITPQAPDYRMASLLIGLVLYVLLHSIPYVGWVVGVIVVALGLGAVVVLYIGERRSRREEAV